MLDTLSSIRLLPKPPLDVVENLRMRGVVLIEDILELEVRRPKPVTEVLRKDPAAVYGVTPPSVQRSHPQM